MNLHTKTTKKSIITDVPSVYQVIAQSALESGMTFNQSQDLLRQAFIDQAQKQGAKSNVEIALKTGIDRRNINPSSCPINNNSNKFLALIGELRKHIKNHDTRILNIKGAGHSLVYYAKSMAGRITLSAIIKELKTNGIVEHYADNKLKILKTRISTVNSNQRKQQLLNKQIRRQASTINHNFNHPDNKLIDYNIASTQINPANQKKLNKIMRVYFNHFRPLLFDLLTKYEERVPPDTYSEYSVNFYINNISEVNNNEQKTTRSSPINN